MIEPSSDGVQRRTGSVISLARAMAASVCRGAGGPTVCAAAGIAVAPMTQ
ncbi:hypothetical protein [Sphingopyxis lindanitolerans]|nr:hypothetical protein [Sphingopyxis lindanitolerans]